MTQPPPNVKGFFGGIAFFFVAISWAQCITAMKVVDKSGARAILCFDFLQKFGYDFDMLP
jgi:hypothetical protein